MEKEMDFSEKQFLKLGELKYWPRSVSYNKNKLDFADFKPSHEKTDLNSCKIFLSTFLPISYDQVDGSKEKASCVEQFYITATFKQMRKMQKDIDLVVQKMKNKAVKLGGQ